MLKVIKNGFFTTVQDNGRYGLRNKGVPVSGAMDLVASSRANQLLENDMDAAVLEVTMTGPSLVFTEDTFICLAGAEFDVKLNELGISNDKVYGVRSGDVLSFGKLKKGLRSYLAVKNGFNTELILGSRSFYTPITATAVIQRNVTIPYESCSHFKPKIAEVKVDSILNESCIEVHKGPEYELLSKKQLELIFFNNFTIAKENNRMAYQLQETIDTHTISMITSATLPGTVQLTPKGKLIILMRDGQTTGGYPRIMQLSAAAISVLAQKKFGDVISFKLL